MKHRSYRGVEVDMAALSRANETSIAVGNMKVNAKGDLLKGSAVAKTSEEMAREGHRIQSTIVHSGLKGPVPQLEAEQKTPVKATVSRKQIEQELPSGDIIIKNE